MRAVKTFLVASALLSQGVFARPEQSNNGVLFNYGHLPYFPDRDFIKVARMPIYASGYRYDLAPYAGMVVALKDLVALTEQLPVFGSARIERVDGKFEIMVMTYLHEQGEFDARVMNMIKARLLANMSPAQRKNNDEFSAYITGLIQQAGEQGLVESVRLLGKMFNFNADFVATCMATAEKKAEQSGHFFVDAQGMAFKAPVI